MVTQIQSFLGLVGFYRRFVRDFSSIAAPLHELTQRDVPFAWSDSQEVAFRTLKDKLTHAPLLQLPDFNKVFELEWLSMHATKLDLNMDVTHEHYKTSKGKLVQTFRLSKHETGVDARGPYPGIYPTDGPTDAGASSPQAPPPRHPYDPLPMEGPSHSCGAPRGKKGKLNFIAKGLFVCFNMLCKDAREHKAVCERMAQEPHRQERNQKDMAAWLNLPHSPMHEMRTFDPPSPVPNPWEDLGSWVSVDEEEEEDYGGGERDEDEGGDENEEE
jgi:hypothetical protein